MTDTTSKGAKVAGKTLKERLKASAAFGGDKEIK
jgi:hypothetical protein